MSNSDDVKKAALEAHFNFQRRQVPHVIIPISVPLHEIDLSLCECHAFYEPDISNWQYEVDLSGACFGAYEIDLDTLSESDREELVQRVISDFNEGPEAA